MPRWGTFPYDATHEIATSQAPVLFTVIVSKGWPAVLQSSRAGTTLDALPPGHEAREIIAEYLAQLATSIALMLSVERVVFGGGVMADGQVMPLVCEATARYLNGYLEPLRDPSRLQGYICAPALGARAGVTGALLLAQAAL